MKVKDLIEQLYLLDQEALVVVEGYEDGYDDVLIKKVGLNLNVNSDDYCGAHDHGTQVSAICISRDR